MATTQDEAEIAARFENANTFFASEVALVIEKHIKTQQKRDPDFRTSEILEQARVYTLAVREFPDDHLCTQARDVMRRAGLTETQGSIIGTLLPELPSQARAYAPSLTPEQIDDHALQDLLDQLTALKNAA